MNTKRTEEQTVALMCAIGRIRQFLGDNKLKYRNVEELTDGKIKATSLKNYLNKNPKYNSMTTDALEIFAHLMGIKPNKLLPDYIYILNPSRKRKKTQCAFEIWYNVDDEPTTEVAIAEEPQEEEPEQETLKDIIDRMGFLITELFAEWDKLQERNNDQ